MFESGRCRGRTHRASSVRRGRRSSSGTRIRTLPNTTMADLPSTRYRTISPASFPGRSDAHPCGDGSGFEGGVPQRPDLAAPAPRRASSRPNGPAHRFASAFFSLISRMLFSIRAFARSTRAPASSTAFLFRSRMSEFSESDASLYVFTQALPAVPFRGGALPCPSGSVCDGGFELGMRASSSRAVIRGARGSGPSSSAGKPDAGRHRRAHSCSPGRRRETGTWAVSVPG